MNTYNFSIHRDGEEYDKKFLENMSMKELLDKLNFLYARAPNSVPMYFKGDVDLWFKNEDSFVFRFSRSPFVYVVNVSINRGELYSKENLMITLSAYSTLLCSLPRIVDGGIESFKNQDDYNSLAEVLAEQLNQIYNNDSLEWHGYNAFRDVAAKIGLLVV